MRYTYAKYEIYLKFKFNRVSYIFLWLPIFLGLV